MCTWVIRRVISTPMSMDRRSYTEPGIITIPGLTGTIIPGPGRGVLVSAIIPIADGRSAMATASAGSISASDLAGVAAGAVGAAAAGGALVLIARIMPGTGIAAPDFMVPDMPATGIPLSIAII